VLVGAAVPPVQPLTAPQAPAFAGLERTIGRPLGIVHVFRPWGTPLVPADLATLAAGGRLPMLSWNAADVRGIASGADDDVIRADAEALAASDVPVLLRFRWEMDRPNLRATVGSPALYVAAWRHAHQLFEDAGADRVRWVWCPTAAGFAAGGAAPAYFPGDDVVDWVCADAYPDRRLTDLRVLLTPFLAWAAHHPQPVMVGELGVPRTADDAARAGWLDRAAAWLRTRPKVRAVVYFDLDVLPDAPLLQFGLDPGSRTADAFGRMARRLGGGTA
jgi:hypothetical protein